MKPPGARIHVMSDAFQIEARDGTARTGVLHTPHGDVSTPAFMPVATQGSVKALTPDDLKALGVSIILGNTYHLYLRPGLDVVQKMGGLHGFMGWDRPMLTDSGGFQGFSLQHLRKLDEEGIQFKSHVDGSLHLLTPESSVKYQEILGADIIMPLDVCAPHTDDRQAVQEAMERTHRWMARCKAAHSRAGQLLFGIVQGGFHQDLRRQSAEFVTSLGVPGYGLGGFSVGEPKDKMYEMVQFTTELLPDDRPRHLLGVGSPEDLVECVYYGMDLFDCVLPTRIARNSALFVKDGRINIDTAPFKLKDAPIEEGCDCYTCRNFSAAYVHHLFRARELLAYRLATIHNLRYIMRLMGEMRQAILSGTLGSFRKGFWERYVPPDQKTRHSQKEKWLKSVGRPKA